MTKLDEMKRYIVDQIMEMDTKEFLKFQDTLLGIKYTLKPSLELTPLFTCDKCIELYGKCREEDKDAAINECEKRFTLYAKQTSDSH